MHSPHRLSRREFVGQLSLAAAAAVTLPRGLRAAASPAGKKVGVALLGLGNYAESQLATALQVTQACRLVGAISGTPAKLDAWKTKFNLSADNLYGYDQLERVADNPEIDVVYVVTPPGTHRDFVVRAAKAGKHVICEKPMAPTVRECEEMIAACRGAGKKLSIGYRLEFEPHHIEMERVAQGFGAAKMTGAFGFHMRDGRPWRVQKALAGGGSLWDLGVYVIQAACRAAGDKLPVAVTAQNGPNTRPEMFNEVEESIRWTMEFADG
ncbi:MAG TPA: Gfo/Idh/MocA family oxidoreductase, partial [Opitutus sp.]|nr:Gfo/Idh/MocA family oxidoreductase [Opitutus sp.]